MDGVLMPKRFLNLSVPEYERAAMCISNCSFSGCDVVGLNLILEILREGVTMPSELRAKLHAVADEFLAAQTKVQE
jgi:hypothetical protein